MKADAPPTLALAPKNAARAADIPEQTLRDLIQRGEIAVSVYGKGANKKRYLIQVADLQRWLDRTRRPAKWESEGGGDE